MPLLETGATIEKTTVKSGTPEGTRTPNLLIRSQTLYPIELRVHCALRGGGNEPVLRADVKVFARFSAKKRSEISLE